MRVNIFVRGTLFPSLDPEAVRRGCCERVGWGALDRMSWPERVGPDGL